MMTSSSLLLPLILGFIVGIGLIYFILRSKLLKIRQKGLNEDAVTKHERCGTNKTEPEIHISIQVPQGN
jgi:hypothetical protein